MGQKSGGENPKHWEEKGKNIGSFIRCDGLTPMSESESSKSENAGGQWSLEGVQSGNSVTQDATWFVVHLVDTMR